MFGLNRNISRDNKLFGALVILLGSIVILGWITHVPLLIQILPSFVPMQFNTALGFILAGLAMCLHEKHPRLNIITCVLLCLLGFLTLIEYIFLVNLNIDELFIQHYISTYTSHPGRMSPNTALCFTLTAAAYSLTLVHTKWSKICSLALGLIVGLLGILSILGYIFGLKFIFGWGNLTGMAFHTALGFSIIGIGSYQVFSLDFKNQEFVESILFPVVTFSIGVIIFLLSWQGMVSAEDDKIKADLRHDVVNISEKLQVAVISRTKAIERIFKRQSLLSRNDKSLIENDINNYFSDFSSLLLFDLNYQNSGKDIYLQKDVTSNISRLAINQCKQAFDKEHTLTEKLNIATTEQYLCLYNSHYQYLAIFDLRFIKTIMDSKKLLKYHIFLKASNTIIGNANHPIHNNQFYVNQWSSDIEFRTDHTPWSLKIWLDNYQVRSLTSDYPFLYLLMGLVFSVLLSISIRIWQISNQNNSLLNEASKVAQIGFWEYDQNTQEIYWSDGVYKIFGIEPGSIKVTYNGFFTFIPEEYRNAVEQEFKNSVSEKRDYFITHEIITKNNKVKYVEGRGKHTFNANGDLIKSVGSIYDVTIKYSSEKKFRDLLENASDGVHILDLEGNVIECSRSFAQNLGYSYEEALKLNVAEWDASIPKDELCGVIADLIKNPTTFETKHKLKNNSIIDVQINAKGLLIDGIQYLYASQRDITPLKKAQQEIQNYNIALKRSNEELESFAYIASHDLKEPLRGIHNYASFLLEDYGDQLDDDGKDQLHTLQKLSKRMEDLINNLLHFSRVGRTELAYENCNLHGIVTEKIEMLQDFLYQNNTEVKITHPLPNVYCDKARIGEIFQNLITNGVKYNDKPNKVITIEFEDRPESITFSVQDNGIGIKEDQFDHIFKIFKRLHARDKYGGGTGAGMTIVKKIIERHNGKIWLTSIINEGTTFYFSIPKTKHKEING
ncbi:ATP-binding protein [Francisellaceae bacterium]|nr:ATP-binding protein [Francisellaceae bacterium]